MSKIEMIKVFLNQYKAYNEIELSKNEEDMTDFILGIIHGITAMQNYIEVIEKKTS